MPRVRQLSRRLAHVGTVPSEVLFRAWAVGDKPIAARYTTSPRRPPLVTVILSALAPARDT